MNESQDIRQKAHSILQEILDSKEFAQQEPSPSWLSKFIDRILEHIPNAPEWADDLLEWGLYFILAIIAISAFIYILKYFKKFPSFQKISHNVIENSEAIIDHETLRDQAYDYLQKGEYRLAIRYIYKSLLLYLDKTGSLVYESGKTDGEYVREFSRNSSREVEEFALLTNFFERKWYGGEESSLEDFQQCENILRSFGL